MDNIYVEYWCNMRRVPINNQNKMEEIIVGLNKNGYAGIIVEIFRQEHLYKRLVVTDIAVYDGYIICHYAACIYENIAYGSGHDSNYNDGIVRLSKMYKTKPFDDIVLCVTIENKEVIGDTTSEIDKNI